MKTTFASLLVSLLLAAPAFSQRLTLSLDGVWQVADSVRADAMPASFDHQAPVPGLANLAVPPFTDVDRFESFEHHGNPNQLRKIEREVPRIGLPLQDRNYFWYRTTFRPPVRKQIAILRINKAQFGTAVWLNGRKLGEHLGCFTAGYFDLTAALHWTGENTLVVRIGAHPAALPLSAPAGTDFEKRRWTPGIYDDVTVLLSDNPVIESVQAAPRLRSSEVVVETRLRNLGPAVSFHLSQVVNEWKGREVARVAEQVRLAAGEERAVRQAIRLPNAKLWTPERPFLYVLETATGGDSASSRFGMREFRFDTPTRRAWLNGRIYFLRGSNITLHRFFEDPQCGRLPWDERWVRRLLVDIPKQMHWNSFRFCIGPVPQKWLDIADEAGLLIQNEFFVWPYREEWDRQEMTRQYREWLRDNWNHPSVAIWDAANETRTDTLAPIIQEVRKLDLSGRPWDNAYNDPVGPDDAIEDHPYLFGRHKVFDMTTLESGRGEKPSDTHHPSGHAAILNEYGWLWVNRDGAPTLLTQEIYDRLLGPNATPGERFELNAYLLAAKTEYWRAHRRWAAVLHFVYLTASYPGAYTSDHFTDVEKLTLNPYFADYVGEAFKPLGVYLNFFQPKLRAGAKQLFVIMLVNDGYEAAQGKLALTLAAPGGEELARSELAYYVPALGQQTYHVEVPVPSHPGLCQVRAAAHPEGGGPPTLSRRKTTIAPE